MTATSPAQYAQLVAPVTFRRHQREALVALADHARNSRAGQRAWVVLPPGAGKTMLALEAIRRRAAEWDGDVAPKAVVFTPNSAIQGQWLQHWKSFERRDSPGSTPADIAIGTDRDLSTPITVLTYQSLAVFDPDNESDSSDRAERPDGRDRPPGRTLDDLHPNGKALVDALRTAGPLTVVLDECHHLLDVWGALVAELVDSLPNAVILGLTATPPDTMTADQAVLVGDLFGEITYSASIPAVVREGDLSPFADLIWLTTPTPAETDWLDEQAERFAELTTTLTDASVGSTPLFNWLDRRFITGDIAFERTAKVKPDLADAALRMHHIGLLDLPEGATVAEQHRHAPTADDWVLLIDDWLQACLLSSDEPGDKLVVKEIKAALPGVGYQVTRDGIRKGRSTVDRVLARSAAKSSALVEIVAAEHATLGDDLALLVICDHETVGATDGPLERSAGSARLALATLLADERTKDLAPIMVTGRTVAAAPDTLRALVARLGRAVQTYKLTISEPDEDGIADLTGTWSTRQWVHVVTAHFASRRSHVLIGTRALLGEGWDAPSLTGLVDLSMATTVTSVVQSRGRSLRLDPRRPDKVAVNWSVCCVAPGHPKGGNDWQRVVRKHDGYFGVDDSGTVVDGVAHVHPTFSPYTPPPTGTFDATNAEMLTRAQQRDRIRELWAVGRPYDDRIRQTAWLARTGSGRGQEPAVRADNETAGFTPTEPAAVLGADGVDVRARVRVWPGTPALLGVLSVIAVVLAVVVHPLIGLAAVGLAGAAAAGAASRRSAALAELSRTPDPLTVAHVVADGLQAAGLSPVGADAVSAGLGPDGHLRVVLETDRRTSETFAAAYAEALAPIDRPRYVVPRYVVSPTSGRVSWLPLRRVRPTGEVWHPVPSVLGANANLAKAYAEAWKRRIGGGDPLYTGSAEGAGVLATHRGMSPFDATCVLRTQWD